MKKLNLSLAAIFAMGTFAVAGGDIAPVEPVVEEPVVVESTGNFYLGLAYGAANIDASYKETYPDGSVLTEPSEDWNYSTIMLQGGYNFNKYIAIEARYWIGLDEDIDAYTEMNIDTFGIYVKPQYSFDAFKVYALLGYANNTADFRDTVDGSTWSPDSIDGFSWGLGAAYAFTENLSVFVDYVDMYNDDFDEVYPGVIENYDFTISSWNFGVTYNF
jgi:opacity protein-like surface antigen